MQVRLLRFGAIEVDGWEYGSDIVIESGRVREGKKKPSSHTAISSGILRCRLMMRSRGAEAG